MSEIIHIDGVRLRPSDYPSIFAKIRDTLTHNSFHFFQQRNRGQRKKPQNKGTFERQFIHEKRTFSRNIIRTKIKIITE